MPVKYREKEKPGGGASPCCICRFSVFALGFTSYLNINSTDARIYDQEKKKVEFSIPSLLNLLMLANCWEYTG